MPLSKTQKQQLKQLIQTQLADLKVQLAMSCESSKTVELDQTMMGRVSRIDAIQQQKIAQAGFERDQRHFQQLTQAAIKIECDDFGYCIECDEEIIFSRLLIKPECFYCVTCQQNKE